MLDKFSIITVDGPAASGKSSVSRELAKRLGWSWVSTGAFYRGLGLAALELQIDLDDSHRLVELAQDRQVWDVVMQPLNTQVYFRQKEVTHLIGHEDVGAIASRISQIPLVRAALLQAQRDCYSRSQFRLVAEGRDCGTVVFPQAVSKIYLVADELKRATRRALEQGAGIEEISQLQKQRDHQDQNRQVAPLTMAQGAHLVDTSDLDLEQVVQTVLALVTMDLKQIGWVL